MTLFQGKVALITGGTKGIGACAAKEFQMKGAKVVINYVNDAESANKTLGEIGHDNAISIQADVSKVSECKKLVDCVVGKYGKIDILVNNAAYLGGVTVSDLNEEQYDKFFDANVKGLVFLMHYSAPHMPRGSKIVNISSSLTASSYVRPDHCLYVATKGAVEQITRTSAKELAASKGINVNALSPGPVETDLFLKLNPPESREMFKKVNPFHRIGTPTEIADAILFLSSPESSWINGQNIKVNGGYVV